MLKNGNITLLGEIRGLKPQRLAADPIEADLRQGLVWVNTTEKALKWYDGEVINRIATGDSLDEYVRLDGADMTGPLLLSGDATEARHAVPFSQLNTLLEGKQDDITGAASTVVTADLTASSVLVSDENGKIAAGTINVATLGYLDGVTSNVQTQLDSKQDDLGYVPVDREGDTLTGDLNFSNSATVTGLRAPVSQTDAVRLMDLDNLASGLDFQPDVLAVQLDDTLVPFVPTEEVVDPETQEVITPAFDLPDSVVRYIVTDASTLNAAFGTIEGLEDGDIIQRNADDTFSVVYDVSERGPGVLAWDRGTAKFMKYNGTIWNEHGGLSGVTAADGLRKEANTIMVDFGGGVEASAEGALTLAVDDGLALVDPTTGLASTGADAILAIVARATGGLTVTADGVGVAAEGIDADKLAAAAFGNGLTGGAGTAVSVRANADASIVVDADGVRVGDLSSTYVARTGDTSVDGQLAVPAPTAETSATNKLYVDNAVTEVNNAITALRDNITQSRMVFDGTVGDALDTYSIQHNFGDKYVQVTVYDENDNEIMPDTIQLIDANNVQVTLAIAQRIRVVITGRKVAV
jgi:hypothetical protein